MHHPKGAMMVMREKRQTPTPTYQKIAWNVAENIVNGNYKKGDTITGRSALAAKYAVSPETIRRAMFILKDLQIVNIRPGVGVVIEDVNKAHSLLTRVRSLESFTGLEEELSVLLKKEEANHKLFLEKAADLLKKLEHYRVKSPIAPYEIVITKKCIFLGKMISKINFWQNTGVTVVAIRSKDELFISPGPYATFKVGDVFILVGPEGSERAVQDFINGAE